MDLGLKGRKAIVCAASKGLGRACAEALAAEGVDLLITARGADQLESTADDIRHSTGATVATLAGDVTTREGRAAILAAMPDPDILVNNAGGPPPGDFRDWDEAAWEKALGANMIAPIMLIRAVVDGMAARRFGRIVNITSGAVKAPIPALGLSNGARTGLTGFIAGLSRQVARNGVTINNLLPGHFATDRLKTTFAAEAARTGRPVAEVMAEAEAANPTGRIGRPDEFGRACAFLCSVHAGFIVGQNILMDGGRFPGTM
ncbi:MAG: SDR family oxidoreductase [Ancalomicrobiaceae bacterium]|nr:SDR family oxidoreductase [Ancalomicrobiaceae bacterium]